MSTDTLQVQVSLAHVSGVTQDRMVNTWHGTVTDRSSWVTADYQAVEAKFLAFYQVVDNYMSNTFCPATGHTFKVYDLASTLPRQPYYSGTLGTLAAPSGTPQPPECSLCLSFKHAYESGKNPQRFRGRVYLGWFLATANGNDGRPSSTVINAIGAAAATLKSDLAGLSKPFALGVWSTRDQLCRTVDSFWIDNEWDTQRRRGRIATTRTAF